jgi:hypothetical protein
MMNSTEFVDAIKRAVRDVAVEGMVKLYSNPPGRAPSQEIVETSKWYNSLDSRDKAMVQRVIKDSVDSAIFGLFSVLDGVRAVEFNPEDRGEFKLHWTKGKDQILLNDFDDEFLHELYNS